jgi:CRISPR-associated endonuclease/helicase Cas3
MSDPPQYLAHSAPQGGLPEPLREHLELVAERAEKFAGEFGGELEARMAGLLHDAGKAAELFTRRLEGRVSGLDHWTPGAALALRLYRQNGIAAALAIQGHHLGLAQAHKQAIVQLHEASGVEDRTLTVSDFDELLERLQGMGIVLPPVERSIYAQNAPSASGLLDLRMLFSVLVDADYLETEAHFDRDGRGERRYRPDPPELHPARALQLVEAEVARLVEANRARSSEDVQRLRADLFLSCHEGAAREPSLFTLSAPTGAGKTLAMLAFALRHADLHGLRRVVLAVPYLSILEQTARIYRDLFEPTFGAGYVLEHHSLAGTRGSASVDDEQGPGPEEVLRRRQAENWDAPLVLTTSVQILESLFANRPKACRKLHRLAGGVLLFDEVQTLPRWLTVVTLATLSRLNERFRASVVFSTATQPAFHSLDEPVRKWCGRGWRPTELVPPTRKLFRRVNRVRVEWRIGTWSREDRLPWGELADELAAEPQILCIFNLRRHARDLARQLKDRGIEGVFHLSTSMCPAHRQAVLAEVLLRLAGGQPARLISTQCIEAGVDVDFPVVYRAFAPLDAIAQAAGRCNRNGQMPGRGRMVVFLPDEPAETAYPSGDYRQAADVTREVLQEIPPGERDLEDPELSDRWYRLLYDLGKLGKEERRTERELHQAMRHGDLEGTAKRYHLIPGGGVQVVVPWDLDEFDELKRQSLGSQWLKMEWLRAAQLHSVSLFAWQLNQYLGVLLAAPLGARLPEQRSEEWFFLTDPALYEESLGLSEPPVALLV